MKLVPEIQYVPPYHSSFLNARRREFMRYFQKQPPDVFCKKTVFLKILQISQENVYARVSF